MNEYVVEQASRLDKFLASRLPEFSRGQIQKSIEEGLVEINGEKSARSSLKVTKGDVVKFPIPPLISSSASGDNFQFTKKSKHQVSGFDTQNIQVKVLYEKDGLLVIDKPAGLTVHPGPAVKGATLVDWLLVNYPQVTNVGESDRPGIVHRLDKETSGCLLVALTPEMYEYLREAFFTRSVKKEYLALVWGSFAQKHGMIDTPMGKSRVDFRKRTVTDPLEAKEAVTEYSVISNYQFPHLRQGFDEQAISNAGTKNYKLKTTSSSFDEFTLIKVLLHTGRTHQIRVHMASIGHPLVGDVLYGPKKKTLPTLHRQFLHANKVEVKLPNNTWVEVESDLPEDLQQSLSSLANN